MEQEPLEKKEKNEQKSNIRAVFREIIIFILFAVGVVLPFRFFIAEPYVVSGASMDPTFATGHYLIVDKISYKFEEPKRNSVIIFTFPKEANVPAEDGRNLIKRVIGLPGDTVVMNGNEVKIINKDNPNGFVLNQSYVTHKSPSNFSVTLKEGQYFVMGDNRKESYDSRSWGILPKEDIIGRPVLRLLPVNEISILPGNFSEK